MLLVVGYTGLKCSCWPINSIDIIDTVGAGDAFIGGVIVGLLSDLTFTGILLLASYVASQKLLGYGARAGLPTVDKVISAFSDANAMNFLADYRTS